MTRNEQTRVGALTDGLNWNIWQRFNNGWYYMTYTSRSDEDALLVLRASSLSLIHFANIQGYSSILLPDISQHSIKRQSCTLVYNSVKGWKKPLDISSPGIQIMFYYLPQ